MAVRSKSNGGGCWGGIFFWCSRWGFTAAFLLEFGGGVYYEYTHTYCKKKNVSKCFIVVVICFLEDVLYKQEDGVW